MNWHMTHLATPMDTHPFSPLHQLLPCDGMLTTEVNVEVSGQSSFGSRRVEEGVMRKGKWTQEEEQYADFLIEKFKSGRLHLAEGVTLRHYLSGKLQCDPMRITKKFTGAACIGKRVFHPAPEDSVTPEEVENMKNEYQTLKARFLARLEKPKARARGQQILPTRNSEPVATQKQQRSVVSTPSIDAFIKNRAFRATSHTGNGYSQPHVPSVSSTFPVYDNSRYRLPRSSSLSSLSSGSALFSGVNSGNGKLSVGPPSFPEGGRPSVDTAGTMAGLSQGCMTVTSSKLNTCSSLANMPAGRVPNQGGMKRSRSESALNGGVDAAADTHDGRLLLGFFDSVRRQVDSDSGGSDNGDNSNESGVSPDTRSAKRPKLEDGSGPVSPVSIAFQEVA